MERKTRFELATLALARRCSTAELLPHRNENHFNPWTFCLSIAARFIGPATTAPVLRVLPEPTPAFRVDNNFL